MASCYYIYCTTLGLSWDFGNEGLGGSTQFLIPESPQSERG